MLDRTPTSQIAPARATALTRSDVATQKRALQDLKIQIKKHSEALASQLTTPSGIVSSEQTMVFITARNEVNQLVEHVEKIEETLARNSPAGSSARLSEVEKTEIKGFYGTGLYTQSQLADQYGITQPAVGQIISKGTMK